MDSLIQSSQKDLSVSPPPSQINIEADLNRQLTYTGNLGVELVATTKDKISNALHESLPKYDRKRAWFGPSSILVTLLVTTFTAEFKDLSWVSGESLYGACVTSALFCAFFTGKALWGLRGAYGHAEIVDSIVNTSNKAKK